MAKTNTELIREMYADVSVHRREIDQLKVSVARIETAILEIRNDISTLNTNVALLQLAQVETQKTLQQSQVETQKVLDDFKKQMEGFRSQLWWLFTAVLGAAFAIIVAILVKK